MPMGLGLASIFSMPFLPPVFFLAPTLSAPKQRKQAGIQREALNHRIFLAPTILLQKGSRFQNYLVLYMNKMGLKKKKPQVSHTKVSLLSINNTYDLTDCLISRQSACLINVSYLSRLQSINPFIHIFPSLSPFR